MARDISTLTLPAALDQVARESTHPTVIFPDEECSYAELAATSRELARGLRALGVGRGDKVGILQMGGIDTLAMLIATMRLGAWAVPINARTAVTALLAVLLIVNVSAIRTRHEPEGWRPVPWVAWVGAGACAVLLAHQLLTASGRDSPSPRL